MSEENRSATLFILIVVALFLFFLGIIFFLSQGKDALSQLSTFNVEPTQKQTPSGEPEVTSWRVYAHPTYNFTVEMPEGWNVQDYAAAYGNNGTRVAFSPDPLPCETCSYFYSGHFSIRVFNHQTDPESYAMFAQRVNAIGKNPAYKEALLGTTKAVAFANTITTEQQGWVYELSLDKDQGAKDIMTSKIMQKVASSFAFTNLFGP